MQGIINDTDERRMYSIEGVVYMEAVLGRRREPYIFEEVLSDQS